jgi:hypothetical protein
MNNYEEDDNEEYSSELNGLFSSLKKYDFLFGKKGELPFIPDYTTLFFMSVCK